MSTGLPADRVSTQVKKAEDDRRRDRVYIEGHGRHWAFQMIVNVTMHSATKRRNPNRRSNRNKWAEEIVCSRAHYDHRFHDTGSRRPTHPPRPCCWKVPAACFCRTQPVGPHRTLRRSHCEEPRIFNLDSMGSATPARESRGSRRSNHRRAVFVYWPA